MGSVVNRISIQNASLKTTVYVLLYLLHQLHPSKVKNDHSRAYGLRWALCAN